MHQTWFSEQTLWDAQFKQIVVMRRNLNAQTNKCLATAKTIRSQI